MEGVRAFALELARETEIEIASVERILFEGEEVPYDQIREIDHNLKLIAMLRDLLLGELIDTGTVTLH